MKNFELENLELNALTMDELNETDGGIIPIVVFGVIISAEIVADLLIAGIAIGATVAATR